MFRFRRNRRQSAAARHPLNRSLRAHTVVEELEPRTLLAAAPIAVILTPVPSPSVRVSVVQLPATAPAQQAVSFTEVQVVTVTRTPSAAPILTQAVASLAVINTSPSSATPNATATLAVLSSVLATPGVFATVPPGTNLAAPDANLAGPQAGREIATERFILLVNRVPQILPFPVVIPFIPHAPSPAKQNAEAIPTPNTPAYFNPAAHRLLFVVGGPEDRSPEDYLNEFEDGRVQPAPDQAPLPILDGARPVATETRDRQVQQTEEVQLGETAPLWPLACERYFAGEFDTNASDAPEVPALATAENTRAGVVRLEDNEDRSAAPELLAAAAAIGLLNGTRWQKEGPRDGDDLHGRGRPRVLPLGPM